MFALPLQCSTDGPYRSPQQIGIHPLIIINHEKTLAFYAVSLFCTKKSRHVVVESIFEICENDDFIL